MAWIRTMKHIINKINFKDVKEKIKAFRFTAPEFIAGFVLGATISWLL